MTIRVELQKSLSELIRQWNPQFIRSPLQRRAATQLYKAFRTPAFAGLTKLRDLLDTPSERFLGTLALERAKQMIEKMRSLLRENSMCVLATSLDNKPHCSLMAYVTDENALTVYMVTLRKSKKHSNITHNPSVSLLVDTRASGAPGAQNILALTVTGSATPLEHEEERKAIIERIVERHPHLSELTSSPEVEVLSVVVESFLLLDGPTKAHFETV